jgi:hypothetical protein
MDDPTPSEDHFQIFPTAEHKSFSRKELYLGGRGAGTLRPWGAVAAPTFSASPRELSWLRPQAGPGSSGLICSFIVQGSPIGSPRPLRFKDIAAGAQGIPSAAHESRPDQRL